MEGDQQKMREALEAILRCVEPICKYARPDGEQPTALFAIADTVRDIVAKALSAPARNCDVGTPEEQDARFGEFCVMRRTGSCAGCPDPVGGFTVANGIRECALVWAQVPYVAEEGGAK